MNLSNILNYPGIIVRHPFEVKKGLNKKDSFVIIEEEPKEKAPDQPHNDGTSI